MLVAALPASAADYTVKINEWLFIPVMLPQAKIGGGDFYNLQLDTLGAENTIEYSLEENGIRLRSENAGRYNFRLVVNHITKSSCAGAEISQYLDDKIQLHVVE